MGVRPSVLDSPSMPDSDAPDADLAVRHDDALARLAAAPEDPRALLDLAETCLAMGGAASALPLIERAESVVTTSASVLSVKARCQFNLGLLEDCLATTARVVGHAPPDIAASCRQLAIQCLLRLGRPDDAAAGLGEIVRSGEGLVALRLTAEIDEARGDREKARARLRPIVANTTLPVGTRMSAAYDLARLCDTLGDHDEAFESATLAAELGDATFDADAFEAETEALIAAFAPDRLDALPIGRSNDQRPVFVVGMPRSGTTLLEQIICAHPEAAGIQEQREFDMFADLLAHRTGRPLAEAIAATDADALDAFAAAYLGMLDDLVPRLDRAAGADQPSSPRRVVNKALLLDRVTGLIARTLPGARFIVIRRAPLDNLLSIFLNPISPTIMPWSCSLEGLVAARRRFDRLTTHWSAVLGDRVLDLRYEDLVADPEGHIRRVIDFLGLPFDDACLSSHRSGRAVMTPSRDQVNKPINRSAVERWRRYERHLGPLLAAFPLESSA